MRDLKRLPMRERQIVEIVSKAREATADEVVHMLEDPVSNSAVRSMLRRLEDKGILQHRADGRKFIYSLSVLHRDPREGALRRIAADYFDGSLSALAGHLSTMIADPPSVHAQGS